MNAMTYLTVKLEAMQRFRRIKQEFDSKFEVNDAANSQPQIPQDNAAGQLPDNGQDGQPGGGVRPGGGIGRETPVL